MTLLAMCVATFMIQLDVTIVNVALPAVQGGLRATSAELEWVVSGYALALAALIPVGGALGDRLGRKRVFLAGTTVFALASAACALANGPAMLIGARILQGVGGAAMLALTLSIVSDAFPAQSRAGAIGTWAAVGGTGFGVGPVVGGLLLGAFGWQSVFWVNVPVAAVAIALTALAVPDSGGRATGRLDVLGLASVALGLGAVTLGLIDASGRSWTSVPVLVPLAAGLLLLALFVAWERRSTNPLIPLTLFRARSYTTACVVYLIGYTAFSGVLFYVTLLYQNVLGYSALRTGLSWLFMNVPFLAVAQLTGAVLRRRPASRIVVSGCSTAALGLLLLGAVGAHTPFALTAAGYVLAGAGFGALVPGVTHAAMRDVPTAASGVASGVVNASRQLGTSVGLAVLGGIGATVATNRWASVVPALPSEVRAAALQRAGDVATAHFAGVVRVVGSAHRTIAVESFVAGYHVAIEAGAACLVVAAVAAAVGFRRRTETPADPATATATPRHP